MDNNIIERIEGLDMLVNLEWLGMKSHISKTAFQKVHVLDGHTATRGVELANGTEYIGSFWSWKLSVI